MILWLFIGLIGAALNYTASIMDTSNQVFPYKEWGVFTIRDAALAAVCTFFGAFSVLVGLIRIMAVAPEKILFDLTKDKEQEKTKKFTFKDE